MLQGFQTLTKSMNFKKIHNFKKLYNQNYYTLYDMDNLQISFTEAIYSNASTLTGSCTSYAHSLFAANILGYILGIILVYF